ncbi:MAG: hypothetical protein AUG80_09715 [Candidatus Rokubacteria bacterium 13_1_20CM_4_68_9]|nr:MAG: hypothetical protein AUG80_09715 [Candidatus Rokubacteria bacterium 13_1_20CM_4_68_9]
MQPRQGGEQSRRLESRHLGGARDEHGTRLARLAEQRLESSQVACDLDEVGAELAEADDLSILEQDREQRVDPLEGRRRHLEQAQGMPGGRRVEHHDVVSGGAGGRKEGLDHADDAEDLVESRWREIDEVLDHGAIEGRVEAGAAAQPVEELVDSVAIPRATLCERGLRVELHDVDSVHSDRIRDRRPRNGDGCVPAARRGGFGGKPQGSPQLRSGGKRNGSPQLENIAE